jgi:hypothetical protein
MSILGNRGFSIPTPLREASDINTLEVCEIIEEFLQTTTVKVTIVRPSVTRHQCQDLKTMDTRKHWQGYERLKRNEVKIKSSESVQSHQQSNKHSKEIKIILITGRGVPFGSGMSRLPHFLSNRFTDGGEVASLKHRRALTSSKIPGTRFYYGLSQLKGYSAPERNIRHVGNRTRDLPTCSVVSEATTLPRVPINKRKQILEPASVH